MLNGLANLPMRIQFYHDPNVNSTFWEAKSTKLSYLCAVLNKHKKQMLMAIKEWLDFKICFAEMKNSSHKW